MHVNGNQLAASRWAQIAKEQAQTDQDASGSAGVQAGNGLKPAFVAENGVRPYFSLGNGSDGAGNNQMFETLAEAIEAMGLHFDKGDRELDDPTLVTDYGDDENGDPIPLPNAEYGEIEGDVFVDGPSLTDVQQGYIGNCYLMAALASLAEQDPEFIENLITDNGDGTYTVHFQGDLGDVTIDDDFPVYTGSDDTVYAETDTGGGTPELWVAIVEKAYAEAYGGYQDTVGGRAHETLAEITGQDSFTTGPTTDFSPEELQAALDNGQNVTASSLTTADAKKADLGSGIISGHAYVVTDVRQNKDGEWEVVVYNPWGTDRDTGDGNSDGFTVLTLEEFNDNFRGAAIMDPLEDAA